MLQGWMEPREIKQGRADVDIGDHKATFFLWQLILTALVAVAVGWITHQRRPQRIPGDERPGGVVHADREFVESSQEALDARRHVRRHPTPSGHDLAAEAE